ncbi:hypothetical protein [Lentibacillus saliphilus]|uniref:hypothetical protein n=1 Tax=Lentibacillus saliphilus TaxID=2737028 RepID=UPI001C2FE5B4|nr:hypothetical protein [Lentibacillus saliphilus]
MDTFKRELTNLMNVIFFDQNRYLRETCTDQERIEHVIQLGETLLVEQSTNNADSFFLRGTLGNLYRIHGMTDRAKAYLTKCLDDARTIRNQAKEIATMIRLGEAMKYGDEHSKALHLFDQAIALCQSGIHPVYLDFALQHKGKCLMELNQLTEAEACFTEALQLRLDKEDPSLIDSTRQAITLLNSLKTEHVDD